MDRNIKNKVYINPNFKGNCVAKSLNTNKTYINKHCIEFQNQGRSDIHPIPGNRKIYVNPNFIPISSTSTSEQCKTSTGQGGTCNMTRNENFNISSNYKYSLVNNVAVNKIQDRILEENKNIYTENISCKEYTNNNLIVAPLARSRYCIVRKKNQPSSTIIGNKPNTNLEKLSVVSSPSFNTLSNYNLKDEIPIKCSSSQSTENVVKIKISKYKTVPISYLTKRDVSNKMKQEKSLLHTKPANCAHFTSLKPNQFKYTKNNRTPIVNKVTVKPVLKCPNKITWQNHLTKTKVLKANFKINNIPCRLYTKYGKCLRQTYGNCQYLHDKKHVSLCRKFLKGICHDKNCSLSHELTAKKMPTCYFYLKGICTKENCPYLHIKISDNIKTCQDFLKGYCENGDKCLFRHVKNDRRQSEMNKLKTNKNVLNKSTVIKRVKTRKIDKKKNVANNKDITQGTKECDVEHRYYKESGADENICQIINIKPTRCKLGTLPSFIQL